MKLKTTEKAVRLIESENTLVIEVNRQDRKIELKKKIEEIFKVKIIDIRTHIKANKKIAYVRLAPESPAIDIATKFGMI